MGGAADVQFYPYSSYNIVIERQCFTFGADGNLLSVAVINIDVDMIRLMHLKIFKGRGVDTIRLSTVGKCRLEHFAIPYVCNIVSRIIIRRYTAGSTLLV